jgi:hypothetical protein
LSDEPAKCGLARDCRAEDDRAVFGESLAIAGAPGPLLERSGQLEALEEFWASVAGGRGGRLVFVRGEAGAGKSTLVRWFCERRPRVLWGACDALFAPPALGPFLDIAHVSRAVAWRHASRPAGARTTC